MIVLFWIYKSRTNTNGKCPIMMRISYGGKRLNFSTNQHIEERYWDKNQQRVKNTGDGYREINEHLIALSSAALRAYNTFEINKIYDNHSVFYLLISASTRSD